MVMHGKGMLLGSSLLILLLTFSGCSKDAVSNNQKGGELTGGTQVESAVKQKQIDTTPVTLTLYGQLLNEEFKTIVADPIKAKYPFITMQLIPAGSNTEYIPNINKLVSSGEVPDIILGTIGAFSALTQMNLFSDLTPLMKENNFDLGKLDPSAVGEIKSYSGNNGILFMPESLQSAALYYNKDLFDKFGVPYPKDGMTWPEATELTKKMSRTEGGQSYYGLQYPIGFMVLNNQLSLPWIDPKTNKAILSTDGWKHWFETIAGLHSVPGNEMTTQTFSKQNDAFMKDRNLALLLGSNTALAQIVDAGKSGLNWDMVTMPTFQEAKDTGIMANAPYYAITSTSKHKDQDFLAISVLLSDEAQMDASRSGKITVLNSLDVKQQFGTNTPELKGKNTAAFFKLKFANPVIVTEYDKIAQASLNRKFQDMIFIHKDINTALREAEEETNELIQEKK